MLGALSVLLPLALGAPPAPPEDVVSLRRFEGKSFQVVAVDLRTTRLRIHWADAAGRPYATFDRLQAALEAEGDPADFLTNAGMYEPDLRPTGLLVAGGRTVAPLDLRDPPPARDGAPTPSFHLKPNGVFALRGGHAEVVTSTEFHAGPDVTEATQSGPLLVWHGALHPAFRAGSPNVKIRSGIGVARDGTVRIVLSRDPVDFHTLARFFRDALACPDALFLDGVVSRSWRPGETVDPASRFGGMISVHRGGSRSR